MDLFIQQDVSFEKAAAGAKMPEDPNQWPQEILRQLFKQVSYMSDFSPHVVMDKVNPEMGYGFGHIEVMNQTETQLGADKSNMAAAGIRQARIPIIIKDGELAPLDLLITDDSKVCPLTESRLREAIFRPQAFDVTARTPGDQSLIGTLYPPYRQNYGFGGGGVAMNVGMGKEGMSSSKCIKCGKEKCGCFEKSASVLEAIIPMANMSDLAYFRDSLANTEVRTAYEKNAVATFDSVRTILLQQSETKLGSVQRFLKPSVSQLVRVEDGYLLKSASHKAWEPLIQQLSRGEALQKLGSKLVMAADMDGAVTMTDGATAAPEAEAGPIPGPISEFGVYCVRGSDGQEYTGYVLPRLIDVEGIQSPISFFTDGTHAAIQADILGIPADPSAAPELPGNNTPAGHGLFFNMEGPEGMEATIPMTLSGSYVAGPDQPITHSGETFDGNPVQVSRQPNIQVVMGFGDQMLVPMHWQWLPLDEAASVDLASSDGGENKQASAQRGMASVEVVSGGTDFSIRGFAVDKLASDQRSFLDLDAAMFLLAGLGVEQGYGMKKLAQASSGFEPIQVRVGRFIHPMEGRIKQAHAQAAEILRDFPSLKRQLFKEAAVLPDPEAVDTVLSIGFINPENLTTFVGYLPELETAQHKLSELLLAARLGMSDVPEGAIEKSVRSVEEVLEGLKTLAFQTPGAYN